MMGIYKAKDSYVVAQHLKKVLINVEAVNLVKAGELNGFKVVGF